MEFSQGAPAIAENGMIYTTETKSSEPIAPLLLVRARPKRMAASASRPAERANEGVVRNLRFLNLSVNKISAAEKASITKEPTEFPVVKKPLTSLE